MALTEIYQGRVTERDNSGITTSVTYSGTKAECDTFMSTNTIGATYAGLGRLSSISIAQQGGTIYTVTAKYLNANGTSGGGTGGTEVEQPDYSFGEYSATIDGSMLSTPLEQHPSYLKNWNYYLIGRCPKATPPVPPSVPAWWSTATATTVMPTADQPKYRWVEHESEIPLEEEYIWVTLKVPTMAGFQNYDRALYTETEGVRCQSYADAIDIVKAKLNKRGTPTYTTGMSGFTSGYWKCDRATISWSGEYWLATLTWTYSPDGWNATLYAAAT